SIPWGGFFAPLRLPSDYFSRMADAGCKHVEFGTESLSSSMLATYRKPFGVDDVFVAHQQALEAGLHVAHYFLLGGPGESAVTVAESLDHIERLNKTVLFFFIGIRIYPHTALYDIALAEGKIRPETNLLQPLFYQAEAIDRDTIAAQVTARAGKRNNWIIGSGGAKSAATLKKMYSRGHTGPLWEFLAG
ncbi:MAG: B12-binding domain-containing radical SAM protein, partial [Deltaproteobacteria bacterium HGW-Deltaproteobacteria-16]